MYYSPKTSTDGLVFHYDTGNTVRSYLGEPTTNLLPNGVAEVHDAASGNAVAVTDATAEKGPGWKKVTITTRGSNYRALQWTYLSMSANITYTFSAVFDWGNLRGKNYFIYFDGDGTGGRTYYRPGDYSNAGSELINSTMPDGKFAGKILHSGAHTHSFFIGNYTTGVSGLNDYFYYKEFQAEANSHPTRFTAGTRSATQGLKDLTGRSTIDLTDVSFDSNAQMNFDGTNDQIVLDSSAGNIPYGTNITVEAVVKFNAFSPNDVMIAYGGNNTNFGWLLQYEFTAGLMFGIQNNPNYGTAGIGTESSQQYLNRYIHMTGVYNGTQVQLYINGGVVATESYSSGIPQATTFRMGNESGRSYYSNMELPLAKIYNRALTADEVQRNFNAVKSRFNIV